MRVLRFNESIEPSGLEIDMEDIKNIFSDFDIDFNRESSLPLSGSYSKGYLVKDVRYLRGADDLIWYSEETFDEENSRLIIKKGTHPIKCIYVSIKTYIETYGGTDVPGLNIYLDKNTFFTSSNFLERYQEYQEALDRLTQFKYKYFVGIDLLNMDIFIFR